MVRGLVSKHKGGEPRRWLDRQSTDTKPDDPSLILRTHIWKERTDFCRLSSGLYTRAMLCMCACTPHKKIKVEIRKYNRRKAPVLTFSLCTVHGCAPYMHAQ